MTPKYPPRKENSIRLCWVFVKELQVTLCSLVVKILIKDVFCGFLVKNFAVAFEGHKMAISLNLG